MFARALIVLLLVLNVGVAAWWALRPAPAPPPSAESPAGVARLQLLSEVPPRKSANGSADAAMRSDPSSGTSPASQALRCFSFGPFDADQATALAAAQTRLRREVVRLQLREAQVGSGNGWHVAMPPFADRAAAQVMAGRIATAGFQDYYVVPDGAHANAIELGRYGSQAAARRRQDSLHAAGFQQARAEPVGESRQQHWIDVAVALDFDAEAMRVRVDAEQAQSMACDAVR